MKKLILDIDEITDDFFEDTRLMGIQVSAKNYRFCWQVNNTLGYNFRLDADIEIELQRKGRKYYFPVYHFHEPPEFLHQYIYHNHYDGEFLLPEFRHLDFLWLMKGESVADGQYQQLIKSVKAIPGVQLVLELTIEHVKNKGNLVL